MRIVVDFSDHLVNLFVVLHKDWLHLDVVKHLISNPSCRFADPCHKLIKSNFTLQVLDKVVSPAIFEDELDPFLDLVLTCLRLRTAGLN